MDEKEKEKRRQLLDDLFDAFSMLAEGNYVSLYDTKAQLTRYSPEAVELFALPGEYIPDGAYNWVDYIHPEDRKRYQDVMGNLIAGGTKNYNLTYRVRTKDGNYGSFRFIGAALRDDEGNPTLIGGMTIGEGLMENTDPITSLRNRYGFFDDLASMIKKGQRNVIMLLGINRLSRINGVYGYSHGNKVLQKVGWMIQEAVGFEAKVYRMTGAQFAFASGSFSEQQVASLYEKIRHKLHAGIRVDGVYHSLTVNGGMLSLNGPKMNERTVYACLSSVYQESKYRRHGSLVTFDGVADYDGWKSFEIIDQVRSCVFDECKGFYLHYQLVFDAQSEKPIGAETLVRWKGEPFGEVFPLEFIPILERDFVFAELADWILLHGMTDGVRFLERDPDFILSINISPVQLEREDFEENLLRIARQTGFPLKNLCLELTKGCRLLDVRDLKETVASLREKGIQIAIDDFGSGFASLDFLREFSVDVVKVDLDLVKGIEEQEEVRGAVQHLTELAAIYGSKVCVKGVETEGMRDILKHYPVSSLQGYFYPKAASADEIAENYL